MVPRVRPSDRYIASFERIFLRVSPLRILFPTITFILPIYPLATSRFFLLGLRYISQAEYEPCLRWNSCDAGKRLLLDVKECRAVPSPPYCYHRQSLSLHGYFYNDLSFFFFLLFSFPLFLSLSSLLRISFTRRNAHSLALSIIGIVHRLVKRLTVNQAVFKIIRLYMLYRGYIFIGPLHRFVAIKAQKLGREREGESSKRGGGKRKSDEEMEKDREEKRAMKKGERKGEEE